MVEVKNDQEHNEEFEAQKLNSSVSELKITSRGNWVGRIDFILSSVGYAVGLGNIWRFPYLCFRNGGATFLIPYTIMLFVAGLPLFYFELAFSQFAGLGPIMIWNASPMFRGLGYGMCIASYLACIIYNVILAWAIYYFFASMTSKLPWSDCSNAWNDDNCRDFSIGNWTTTNETFDMIQCNATSSIPCLNSQSPSEQYWERIVLGMTQVNGYMPRLDEGIGSPQPYIVLSLLLAWVFVFFCLINGVKSSGKVVYFTATFPYVLITILLIRGVTLPGASKGIEFYMLPKWDRLLDSRVWADAAGQIFYSLGPCWGGLMIMSSFNKFKNNCYRDAILVSFINCGTSFYAGFAIFSVLGFMSFKSGIPVDKVAQSGPGLVFVAYPIAIASMPAPQLWSILFFFMIFLLGVDTQFVMMETVITSLTDLFPMIRKNEKVEKFYKFCMCFSCFLLGIPICCKGGIYFFELINWYSSSWSLFIIGILELFAVCYVYGIKKFMNDIRMMLGHYPGPYWIVCWLFLTPAAITFILIFSIINYVPIYIGNYIFPAWMEVLGFLIAACSLVPIPICMFLEWRKVGALKDALKETVTWGPSLDKHWVESSRYSEKLKKRSLNKIYSNGTANDQKDAMIKFSFQNLTSPT